MLQVFTHMTAMTAEQDWHLVALSGAVCFLASAVAISLFHRIQAATGWTRLAWLVLNAFAAGFGFWATHFIAVLASEGGGGISYNPVLTILLLLITIVTTGLGLGIALRSSTRWNAALAGAVIGGGVAAMHYTGMIALEVPGRTSWSSSFIFASILLSFLFGGLAFFVAAKRNDGPNTIIAAALLTFAILSTHYTAMEAVLVLPAPARIPNADIFSSAVLSLAVAGIAAIILGMSLVAAFSERLWKSRLRHQKILLDTALENMSQGLCMFDSDGRIVLFNERYTEMMGLPAAWLKNKTLLDFLKEKKASGDFNGDPDDYFAGVMLEARQSNTSTRIIERTAGRSLRVTQQPMQGGGWVATFEDVTEWLATQAKISHMAHHDALTNLPNRMRFREQLELALSSSTRNEQVAVFCLDLDHFKQVNDSLGHPIGDELLKEVARRLSECIHEGDIIARLGGDEFAIVRRSADLPVSVISGLADRLIEVVNAPYIIQGYQVIISTSIGISVAPNDGNNPDQLLKNADMALYRAKADGRGTCRFFEAGMDARAHARRILELELRAAFLKGEFEVHYQPIHNLKTDEITSFEALLRWKHPLRGMIPPGDFIPLAEETGLIVPIGDWVLRTACADAAKWSKNVGVAVNLSAVQFKDRQLVSSVTLALSSSGLPANRLELEITESILLQDNETTLAILHKLRDFGIRISMDDFGTGYSSLSYLRSFPFDIIKIDHSFVRDLTTRGDSMAIVRAVTGLAKSLGISTTAEGVETKEQVALLRSEGCDEAQGFLYSAARPANEVETMLSNGRLRIVA